MRKQAGLKEWWRQAIFKERGKEQSLRWERPSGTWPAREAHVCETDASDDGNGDDNGDGDAGGDDGDAGGDDGDAGGDGVMVMVVVMV